MKTITMMQLRKSPGEYAFRVRADKESFIVTYQGKPCFKMVPVTNMESDHDTNHVFDWTALQRLRKASP